MILELSIQGRELQLDLVLIAYSFLFLDPSPVLNLIVCFYIP